MSYSTLQRLLLCVPPDTFNLANSFLDEIESIRFDSITRHRTLTVLPIAMLPEDKYPKKFLPPQQEFIQHVLSRPVLTSREATPTFIQYASLLVNYVHKNISLFAQAMAVRMDKCDSHYLIYSVIPGLFGFFISHDHTARAVEFYKAIMKIVPPEMASEIMKPFFTSVITYRFVEAVMYPFIYRFTSDPKIIKQINLKSITSNSSPNKLQSKSKIKTSQSFISDQDKHGFFSYFKRKTRNSFSNDASYNDIFQYAKMLCDLIIQSIPLLPVEALELIDLMYQRHWTQSEFNDFFFDHFFSYVSSLYISASPCLRADPVFKDVLNCVKNSSLLNPKFFHKAYFEGLTRFEIPPLYSMLDLPYLDFALTIADVAVATNAIENITELPPSLQGISYSKFSKDKFFKMFAVRSFVRKSQVSDLCLTMCPTQLANESKKKSNKKKQQKENENDKNLNMNDDYNYDEFNFGNDYQSNFYNLDIDPKKRPKVVDYNKEKSEMVVFNIKKFEVEDNPEFERIFLQEHFSSENEEKSANDITIDLIERIGPDACNFSSFNPSEGGNSDDFSQGGNAKTGNNDLNSKKSKKIFFDSNSTDNNVSDNLLKSSPSNEDLTIGRLAKEMDTEAQKPLVQTDSDQLINPQFNNSFINISSILNDNQSSDIINDQSPIVTGGNNNNVNGSQGKRGRKRFNSHGMNIEESDDCFTHDGISNTFTAQMMANQTSELSMIPLDADSLSTINAITKSSNNSSEESSSTQIPLDTQSKGQTSSEISSSNDGSKEETSSSSSMSVSHSSLVTPSSSSPPDDKKSQDWNLKVYLAKRRANLLIDQSHVFENYIRFRLASDQYASFTSLLTCHESIILAPLAMNLATFARQFQLTVSNAYLKVEKFFNANQLKRLIFFIVLSRGPKKCLSSVTVIVNVNACDSITRVLIEKVLKSLDVSYETNKLHRGESEFFWRTVEALQVMKGDIPVAMQIEAFNYVLNTLREVEKSIILRRNKCPQKVEEPPKRKVNQILSVFNCGSDLNFESLLFLALLNSGCETLPARYIIFDYFIEKENTHFSELLGSVSEANWTDFGKFLTHFTSLSEMENLRNSLQELKIQLDLVDNEI